MAIRLHQHEITGRSTPTAASSRFSSDLRLSLSLSHIGIEVKKDFKPFGAKAKPHEEGGLVAAILVRDGEEVSRELSFRDGRTF